MPRSERKERPTSGLGSGQQWDGTGLPPAAAARMARGRGPAPASLMSIGGQAGLEGCGFEVVGEVMGCIVQHIGWSGYGGCGYYGGYGYSSFGNGPFGPAQSNYGRTISSGAGPRGFLGYAAYVDALYAGYDKALVRMLTECQGLGGDGVVGITYTVRSLGEENEEFLCYGTAVRAQSKSRPRNLFSTDLPAQDVAKLLHGGWAPVGFVVGIAAAVRHDDWATRQQASLVGGNTEISGYTDLVTEVRADARRQFGRRCGAYGAEGTISSDMRLTISERECGERQSDHIALATMSGTAVARFHRSEYAPTESLKILPLGGPRRRS